MYAQITPSATKLKMNAVQSVGTFNIIQSPERIALSPRFQAAQLNDHPP